MSVIISRLITKPGGGGMTHNRNLIKFWPIVSMKRHGTVLSINAPKFGLPADTQTYGQSNCLSRKSTAAGEVLGAQGSIGHSIYTGHKN